MSDIFSKIGQKLLQFFINNEILTIEFVSACLHSTVKASPEDILQTIDGEISKTDRRLLNNSLEEYQFYTLKIKEYEASFF